MTNGAATSPSPTFGATDLGDEDVAAPRKALPNDPYLSSDWGVAPLEALIGQCLTSEVKVPDRVRRQGLDGAAAFLPP